MKYRYLLVIITAITLCVMNVSTAKLSDGLFGYWPLDGNGKDESGNGHDVELANGAKFINKGWIGGGIEVDGAGGHAVVDGAFSLTTSELTVAARINGWKTIDWSGIVVGRQDPSSFWLGVAANNTLTYVWNNNHATTWNWQGAPAIPQNTWALVAIAIDAEKATSYIYHRDSGELDSAENEIPHIEQTVANLKFGWDECCGARYFKGIIDEVMIYDRTLNSDEIKKLATEGYPLKVKINLQSHGVHSNRNNSFSNNNEYRCTLG